MQTGRHHMRIRASIARLRRKSSMLGISLIALTAVTAAWLAQEPGAPTPSSQLSAYAITPPANLTVTYRNEGAEILSNGSIILPLDAYDAYAADPANEKLVYQAATVLEQACMQALHLTLPAGWGGKYLTTAPPPLVLYGVATTTEAQQYGYRLPEPASAQAPTPAIPPAVVNAFNGKPGHPGCAGQAYNLLDIAQANNADATLETLRAQAQSSVDSDPRFKAATTAWSACMKRAGYNYPDPLAPEHDRTLLGRGLATPKGASLPPVSPIERHVAEIDVNCKNSSDYLQTYATLSATYQQRLIQRNTVQLKQALIDWAAVLRLAHAHQTP